MLKTLYGSCEQTISRQKQRYSDAVDRFRECFPDSEEISVFSAPGRTEIGGNHTDHQHGCVLAAAVNLDIIAVVSFNNMGVIRLQSEGHSPNNVDLSDLSVQNSEKGDSSALIRGIASKFCDMGVEVRGFDAYTTSDVLSGSGLSSSAAFEVLIGTIIDRHYNNGKVGAVEIAKIGQYAENEYFGKKSGLMDQMVSSVGGLVSIDFHDTGNPKIQSFPFDFKNAGYCLCVTDTKGSHADLTDDYVAIRSEMENVAAQFGKAYLRDVNENDFYGAIPQLREKCSDRAVLRTAHFFDENRRAVQESNALSDGNMDDFLELVMEKMFKWTAAAHGLRYVSLRYFNACGADESGTIGESHNPESHLIPLILQVPNGKREAISIYGTDYDTPDGTCIRDYIHVTDLAQAHILAVQYLMNGGESDIFNLGNGVGYSVREVIETARKITGHPIPAVETERRAGDPARLVASSEKAKKILGWKPVHDSLDEIIASAWNWHKTHPNGYGD